MRKNIYIHGNLSLPNKLSNKLPLMLLKSYTHPATEGMGHLLSQWRLRHLLCTNVAQKGFKYIF